jgi:hypothetical protein
MRFDKPFSDHATRLLTHLGHLRPIHDDAHGEIHLQ